MVLPLLTGGALALPKGSAASPSLAPAAATPVSIVSINFAPNPVAQGSSLSISVTLSGGTPSYYLWVNGTPPGCSPSTQPLLQNGLTAQFNCVPTATGSFSVHLDVSDSSVPTSRAFQSSPLTVTPGGGGNNNNNGSGNGTGGFSLPSGLLPALLLFGLFGIVTVVIIAGSLLAMAILIPRRIRQLTAAIERQTPKEPAAKPPAP